MKNIAILTLLVFSGILIWRFFTTTSSDTLSLMLGIAFGVLAGIPAALLVLVSGMRRSDQNDAERCEHAARTRVVVRPVYTVTEQSFTRDSGLVETRHEEIVVLPGAPGFAGPNSTAIVPRKLANDEHSNTFGEAF